MKLQQIKYLDKEKEELFQRFNKTVYEIHQKSGLKVYIDEWFNLNVYLESSFGEEVRNIGGIN